MSGELSLWEKFCLRVGLYRDVKEPAPVPSPAPSAPAPSPASGVLTLGDKIDGCLRGVQHVVFFAQLDEPDEMQRAHLRSTIAERLRAEPHLAVLVEVPAGSRMVVPQEIHFVEDGGEPVEALVERVVAGRRGVFDSDFFRLDVAPPAGPVTRSYAPEGQSVPPRELPAFEIKKETGGGTPPPVRKR